jgi:hypothetical protein
MFHLCDVEIIWSSLLHSQRFSMKHGGLTK